ncbi:MAG TPA: cupin domain-containing protein [Firmicutes bacterium]|nr:cupin domain-containing protein [Bacillota bacterium]
MAKKEYHKRLQEQKPVEMMPGIFRTTLAYNDQLMLCHFQMKKGAKIPLHSHEAVQNGYVIKGKVRFFTKDGRDIIVEPGSSYVFDSYEEHGSEVLEDTELIESFTPMRPEYVV